MYYLRKSSEIPFIEVRCVWKCMQTVSQVWIYTIEL